MNYAFSGSGEINRPSARKVGWEGGGYLGKAWNLFSRSFLINFANKNFETLLYFFMENHLNKSDRSCFNYKWHKKNLKCCHFTDFTIFNLNEKSAFLFSLEIIIKIEL